MSTRINISQAAKLYGIDRSTIYRDRDQGLISLDKDHKGKPYVELSELIRAYGEPPKQTGSEDRKVHSDDFNVCEDSETTSRFADYILAKQYDAVVESLKRENETLRSQIRFLEENYTENRQQVRQLLEQQKEFIEISKTKETLLLTYHKKEEDQRSSEKRGFFNKLLAKV